MSRARLIQLVGLLCCVGLILAAATRVAGINQGRRALNMQGHESPVENAPPGYAFAVQVLGAFRSLITDIAFIRAEQFKEQGRYYDAMQLAEWICALQPQFPAVWEFASWNMAWNISVTTFTPEERWNWVYNGVKLLRDRGIPLNPRAVNLYKQLAWTFNNKMGDTLDDQHYAYKCNWAWRMHLLLGPPPSPYARPDVADVADRIESAEQLDLLEQAGRTTAERAEEWRRQQAELHREEFKPQDREPGDAGVPEGIRDMLELRRAADLATLQPIADAPRTLDKLYAAHPDAAGMVAELRRLGAVIDDDALDEDAYWNAEGLAFTFFKPYRDQASPQFRVQHVGTPEPRQEAARKRAEEIGRILGVSAQNPAGVALVQFLQRKVLTEVYKLDPAHLIYLVQAFGPMDWRSVDAQGLYWTTQALIAAGVTEQDYTNDKTNTARIMFFCLRGLFLHGDVTFEPLPEAIHLSYLNRAMDLGFMGPLNMAYVRYGRMFDPDTRGVGGAGNTFRSGHVNFLSEMIRVLYLSGYEREARYYYTYLQDTYPTTTTGEPNPAFLRTLHDYVAENLWETSEVPGLREMTILINGLLTNAYNQLAQGDVERYVQLVRQAERFHRDYTAKKEGEQIVRMQLPEFGDMQIDAFGTWLARPARVETETVHKVRLWRQAPLFLRQAVYDPILPMLTEECDYWGINRSEAFPEPKGMADYRAAHPERYRQEREGQIETLPQGSGQ